MYPGGEARLVDQVVARGGDRTALIEHQSLHGAPMPCAGGGCGTKLGLACVEQIDAEAGV